MTDLSTIATAIEIGLERGMTGQQAINLLRQIRDQIRGEEREAALVALDQVDREIGNALDE